MVVGYTSSTEAGDEDVLLLGIAKDGSLRWRRRFGGDRNERAWRAARTPDGGMVLAGETQSVGECDWDTYLLRLSRDGSQMWAQVQGADGVDRAFDVAVTDDGGFIVVGTTATADDWNIFLIASDEMGDPVAEHTLRSPGPDRGVMIVPTADGGYLLTGALGTSDGSSQFGLLKVRP